MVQLGADPIDLEAAARSMRNATDQLEIVSANGTRAIGQLWWVGLHADGFRHSWSGRDVNEIRAACELLGNMADDLNRQAAEQRRTSEGESFAPAKPLEFKPSPLTVTDSPSILDRLRQFVDLSGVMLDSFVAGEMLGRLNMIYKTAEIGGRGGWEAFEAAINGTVGESDFVPGWFGYLVDGADITINVAEHGWTDGRTYISIVDAVGGGVSDILVPGWGGVVWSAGFGGTGAAVNWLDDRQDFTGAFVDSVIAREGKVPDYSGVDGIWNWTVDGFENAIFGW